MTVAIPGGRRRTPPLRAGFLLAAGSLLLAASGAVSSLTAQEKGGTREVDGGRFRILRDGEAVATEVFAIRRGPSAVKSVARLTAGRDTALLSDRIVEARLQTNSQHEPVLFELQVQRGGSLNLVGVRSGDRFRLRTRSTEGERWKEFLVPSGLVILPRGFVHFHHFLFPQRSEGEGGVTAILPREGVERRVRFAGQSADTIQAAGTRHPATRWEIMVGEERRLVWRDPAGRILRVEIPSENWVARRLPGDGLEAPVLRDRAGGGGGDPRLASGSP